MVSASGTTEQGSYWFVACAVHSMFLAVLSLDGWLFSFFRGSHWSQPCHDPSFPCCLSPLARVLTSISTWVMKSAFRLRINCISQSILQSSHHCYNGQKVGRNKIWTGIYALLVCLLTLALKIKGCPLSICCSIYLANPVQAPTSLSRFDYLLWVVL